MMLWFPCFVLVSFISVTCGSTQCSNYEFQCENGECIDSVLWCDSDIDCSDGTDEKYCKRSSLFNKNPNKCPSAYFKCGDGPCIPVVGRCDEFPHCSDDSDEKGCQHLDTSFENGGTTTASTPVNSPETQTSEGTTLKISTTTNASAVTTSFTTQNIQVKVKSPTYLSDSSDAIVHSIQTSFSSLKPSKYSHQRENARDWLLSQRKSDFGWDAETPRAITALYLSDMQHSTRRNDDLLMVKQLEVQLSLGLARNGTKAMDLTDLALYINALLASCKDPKNFHGENLVHVLRNSVNAAQNGGKFVNPSVYLTLCINNATTYNDAAKLHDLFTNRNGPLNRMDIQALVLLTSTCVYQKTNFLRASAYENMKRLFIHKVNISDFPGNVYEASLIFQALHESETSLPGLLEFILRQQQDDGSFGDILATYLVLPVLAGRSLLHMNDHCGQRYVTDPAPIEVLKNVKSRKIHVQYSLNYGNPPEITQTIQMKVADGINFLDVMRLAQEINPKYRFMLDNNREIPAVYSIGGIPNDAEKGMYWTLHVASHANANDAGRLVPYSGNIKQLIPHNGDEFVFWMRSV